MIKLTDILNEDCWKDYKQVGLKKKNGKMVPNCVPESVVKEDESVNEAIPPPNSKKVEALKKAVQKINKKYKVKVSSHPVTKGEVEIILGSGNHPDNDYNTIDKLVKKLGIKHYSVFNESINETAKRDYKDEYKKFQSSTKSKKYRAELNKYNRDKGTYGNGDGKDASHKGGKIVGFESEKKNRGRAEKSRLKKK